MLVACLQACEAFKAKFMDIDGVADSLSASTLSYGFGSPAIASRTSMSSAEQGSEWTDEHSSTYKDPEDEVREHREACFHTQTCLVVARDRR